MRLVSRQEFAKLLLDEGIPFDDRKNLVINDFGLEIPSDIQSSEALLEYVYDYYLKAMEVLQLEKKKLYVKSEKKPREGTVKDWIVNYIITKKSLTQAELRKAVDERFEYSKDGKSPRTRIRKVLMEMESSKLIRRSGPDSIEYIGV